MTVVRPVRAADLEALCELERLCFGREAWSRALVQAELDADNRVMLVAELGAVPANGNAGVSGATGTASEGGGRPGAAGAGAAGSGVGVGDPTGAAMADEADADAADARAGAEGPGGSVDLADAAGAGAVSPGGGGVVGYVSTSLAGPSADLLRIAVHPGHRRTGLGRALLKATLDALPRAGCEEVLLEVHAGNTPALRLYEAYGFERISVRRGYYDGGRGDALLLRLDLLVRRHGR